MAEYSDHGRSALLKALRLAALEKCEKLYVIRVYTTFDEARAKTRMDAPEIGSEGARTLEEEEIALALAFGRYRYGTDRRCRCAFAGLLA